MRTFLCTTVLGLTAALQASMVCGQTLDPRTFAICTGRLSALMEHEWLLSDSRADQTERQRDAMQEIAEAVTPPQEAAAALNLRIEAKQAQAALLSLATFSGNATTAGIAARRSEELISECTALLLG